MEKFLIEISLPAAHIKHDFFVPENMQAGVLAQLAGQVFAYLSDGQYQILPGQVPVLCDAQSGHELDLSMLLMDEGVKNGTSLLLF